MRSFQKSLPLAAALFAMCLPAAAPAKTASGDVLVSASVAANCLIRTSPIDFGTYVPSIGVPTTTLLAPVTSRQYVTCTSGTVPNIQVASGYASDVNAPHAGPIISTDRNGGYGGGDNTCYTFVGTTFPGGGGGGGDACLASPAAPGALLHYQFSMMGAQNTDALGSYFIVRAALYDGQDVPAGAYSGLLLATIAF